MPKKNIALIGPRGAGKSKVSRKLTKKLSMPVFSVDTLISYECQGESIETIVKKRGGWSGFRSREFFILERLCQMNNVIVDCGGGILVEAPEGDKGEEHFSEKKADTLKSHCFVIYLKRPMNFLATKIAPDPNRPNLIGDYETLLNRRLPWYESVADLTVDLEELGGKDSSDLILPQIPEHFLKS
jgi:shikimate kinase